MEKVLAGTRDTVKKGGEMPCFLRQRGLVSNPASLTLRVQS